MKKIIVAQFIVLLIGTLFAWSNFVSELIKWLNGKSCTTSCAINLSSNPFISACFYGAIFFTAAFVLSAVLLKKRE